MYIFRLVNYPNKFILMLDVNFADYGSTSIALHPKVCIMRNMFIISSVVSHHSITLCKCFVYIVANIAYPSKTYY